MAKNVISVDTKSLDKIQKQLGGFPKEASRVLNRVLNRTTDYARVEITRQIPKTYAISGANIRSAISRERGRHIGLVGNEQGYGILISGSPLKIVRFKHTPNRPPAVKNGRQKAYKVKVEIFGNSGKKILSPRLGADGKVKNPFIATTGAQSSDKIPFAIFMRTGVSNSKGREAIKPISTLSVPQMVLSPKVSMQLLKNIGEKVEKETMHEIAHMMDKEFNIKK